MNYIVTSRNKDGGGMTIWHFRNRERAMFEYKELKRLKYPRVYISKIIKDIR